jgi:hypothetical protein
MAFSLIAHVAAGSTNGGASVTTAGINTTGANLLVLALSYDASSSPTVTDSNSNTWTPLTTFGGSGESKATLYYCFNPTVGAGHTFGTTSLASSFPSVCVQAWSGATSSPFDVQNGTQNSSSTSILIGSVTPSVANSMLATMVSLDGSFSSLAVDSGFTISDQVAFNGGQSYACGMAYLVETSIVAENPTWSWANGVPNSGSIASFKPAAASPDISWNRSGEFIDVVAL